MILFISPAKTFRMTPIKPTDKPIFLTEAHYLVQCLQKISLKALKTNMKLSDKIAEQTHLYYQNFNLSTAPAIYSYFGHQFKHIAPDTLDKEIISYMNQHLYILSGLYGLLRPLDGLSSYRLEMQDQTITNLYNFWSDKIINHINMHHKNQLLINLASHEYGQLIEHLDNVYTILFYQIKHKKTSIHSMEAKKLRGLMTRHILTEKIDDLKTLKSVVIEGYTYNDTLSNDKTIVYTKVV